ncbi:MAG: cytochrome P460 family protein [Alphaproteobacteria bacterium]|nr:cytochrome P460 family protein [Alphaproteobacteria bacterium]
MRKLTITLAAVAAVGATAGVYAATEDVGLPANYRQAMANYTVVDRTDNGQVRVLYGPQAAIDAVRAGRPAPSGTTLIMEIYTAQRNAQNELVRGADGRLQRGALANIFVMEKRTGWGSQYPAELRNGEWEYAIFTPAMQRAENRNMQPCMTCHLQRRDADFVFSTAAMAQAR